LIGPALSNPAITHIVDATLAVVITGLNTTVGVCGNHLQTTVSILDTGG